MPSSQTVSKASTTPERPSPDLVRQVTEKVYAMMVRDLRIDRERLRMVDKRLRRY
jgi:hypothetical protein